MTVSPPIFSNDLLVVCQLTIFHDIPVLTNRSVKTVSGTFKKDTVINVLFIIINATLRQVHECSSGEVFEANT